MNTKFCFDNTRLFKTQYGLNFSEKIIVDFFAGGGGASTGLEMGLNRPVYVAVNHNPKAVAMHEANHPHTIHYVQDVFAVDPVEICDGYQVGWFHASPDCTHHSQAAGGQPRKKEIRDLSWVVIKFAGKMKPDVITLENVKQILNWGPLIAKRDKATGRVITLDKVEVNGKLVNRVAEPGERVPRNNQFLIPNPKKKGKTWRHFVRSLEKLGYVVEWNKRIIAADYGAPTTRERLFLIGQALVDQVGEELGCEMPSPSVVRRKALAEKWKKKAKSLVKKTAQELNKEIKKLTKKNNGQEDTQNTDKSEKSDSQNSVKKTSNIAEFNSQNSKNNGNNNGGRSTVNENYLKSALVVKNNRIRAHKLGELITDTIDSVIHIRDEVLNLNNPTEDELALVKFKMGLISQVVDLNVKQSISISNIARTEAMFWGLDVDDLKDQSEVQARRSSVISGAEERMAIAKANMKKKKEEAFMRKLALIEAGEVEPEDSSNE
ncbi:DNA cytosine methyltransferase [Acinetobacter baumannii]